MSAKQLKALKIPPKEVPMEPYYTLMLNAVPDIKHKKCLKAAIVRYHKNCEKAYKQLIKDLKKCQ